MWLIEKTGEVYSVAYYLMTVCAITIITTLYSMKSK